MKGLLMPPTLDADGWELESAVLRNQASPQTFAIPSEAERTTLKTGDRVKLLFLLRRTDDDGPYIQCERMWVTVTEVTDAAYLGRLESLPNTSDVVRPGDSIAFGPDDVAALVIPKDDPRHPEYGSRVDAT